MYSNRPVPKELKEDKLLWGKLTPTKPVLSMPCFIGEGIAGALEWRELMRIATGIGFTVPVLVEATPISINDPNIRDVVGKLV